METRGIRKEKLLKVVVKLCFEPFYIPSFMLTIRISIKGMPEVLLRRYVFERCVLSVSRRCLFGVMSVLSAFLDILLPSAIIDVYQHSNPFLFSTMGWGSGPFNGKAETTGLARKLSGDP